MDLDRKRPLEVRVRQIDISERDALRFGRVSADAVVLLRALFDEEKLSVHVSSCQGATGEELSTAALFHLWVSFTGYLARRPIQDGASDEASQVAFLQRLLVLLGLTPELGPLTAHLAKARLTLVSPVHASDPSPASHTPPPGEPASSTD